MPTQIQSIAQLLNPGEYVEMYEVDATTIGGEVLRFHGHMGVKSLWWQGKEFLAFPCKVEGFEVTGEGQQPNPTLSVANVNLTLTPLVAFLDDLIGAKFTRYRTMVKFLDAKNFPEGNPDANPQEQFPPEIYYIHQKTNEDLTSLTFSLKTALDLDGVMLPRRQIVANLCTWTARGGYRGAYCGYTGSVYTDENGNVIKDPNKDTCNGTLAVCKLKHGKGKPLPYGGFPAATLVKG